MDTQVAERDVARWPRELDRVAERFGRRELRARAPDYLRGLVTSIERKNGWQLAEFAGDATPVNLQHFIGRAKWDAGGTRARCATTSSVTLPSTSASQTAC